MGRARSREEDKGKSHKKNKIVSECGGYNIYSKDRENGAFVLYHVSESIFLVLVPYILSAARCSGVKGGSEPCCC